MRNHMRRVAPRTARSVSSFSKSESLEAAQERCRTRSEQDVAVLQACPGDRPRLRDSTVSWPPGNDRDAGKNRPDEAQTGCGQNQPGTHLLVKVPSLTCAFRSCSSPRAHLSALPLSTLLPLLSLPSPLSPHWHSTLHSPLHLEIDKSF